MPYQGATEEESVGSPNFPREGPSAGRGRASQYFKRRRRVGKTVMNPDALVVQVVIDFGIPCEKAIAVRYVDRIPVARGIRLQIGVQNIHGRNPRWLR